MNPSNSNGDVELRDKLLGIFENYWPTIKRTHKSVDEIMQLIQAERDQSAKESLNRIRSKLGWEEEPDFDPGDATYGDTEHDHAAVIYGRNEVKGAVQGMIEAELAQRPSNPEQPKEDSHE